MSELDDKIHELIDAYKKEVLHKFFPFAKFKEAGSITSNNIPPRTFDAVISNEGLFENTDYKFNPNTHFIHFTSLPVLSQILKSGFLRMSDFNCLSDKSELQFASIRLSESENKNIEKAKQIIYSLSACLSSPEILNNQHMWSQYANKGMGCAIEYKFVTTNIHNMVFGKILYGKKSLKSLRKLKKLDEQFKNKYEIEVTDLPMLLLKVSAFHKKIKFKNEQEVRLLFYNETRYPKHFIHRTHYKDFYSDQEVHNFIKLYNKGKNPENPKSHVDYEKNLMFEPEIEISRVIIGPNNPNPFEVAKLLSQLKEKLEYNFEICFFQKEIKSIN
jgi:hypothetical protein